MLLKIKKAQKPLSTGTLTQISICWW